MGVSPILTQELGPLWRAALKGAAAQWPATGQGCGENFLSSGLGGWRPMQRKGAFLLNTGCDISVAFR